MINHLSNLLRSDSMFLKTLLLLTIITGCTTKEHKLDHLKSITATSTVSKGTIKVFLAVSAEEQVQGLSGIKSDDLGNEEGMLFVYKTSGPRRFWMPDTYINLDLFYLDKNLKIIEVVRNLQHHPGRDESKNIPYAPTIYAQHVFEMKTSSPRSLKLQKGESLVLDKESATSLQKILSDIHP
jgi:uncharacterized membrane protein (UPF0127 family)